MGFRPPAGSLFRARPCLPTGGEYALEGSIPPRPLGGWAGPKASAWHRCGPPGLLIGPDCGLVLSLLQLKGQMVLDGGQNSKDLMPKLQPL